MTDTETGERLQKQIDKETLEAAINHWWFKNGQTLVDRAIRKIDHERR